MDDIDPVIWGAFVAAFIALLGVIIQAASTRIPRIANATGVLTGASIALVEAMRTELNETKADLDLACDDIDELRKENARLTQLRVGDLERMRELERKVKSMERERSQELAAFENREQELIIKVDQLIQVVRRLAKQVKALGGDPEIDSEIFNL